MTDLPLFAPLSEDDIKAAALAIRARLVPIAQELALKAGRGGISSSNVRIAAVLRGILSGKESEHFMNLINVRSVMHQAGLVATREWRVSAVRQAKGSPNRVYVVPEFAEVA